MAEFGEEFQGMTDREILVSMYKDVKYIKSIKCPSDLCKEHREVILDLKEELKTHDNRLQSLEDSQELIEKRKQNRYAFWGLLISAVAGWGGLILALAALLLKGD